MSKLLKIYEELTEDIVGKDDPRRRIILREMQGVRRAKTVQEARKFIDWWDCWYSQPELDAWIRKARRKMEAP